MKFALVSYILPPSNQATPLILERLLRKLPPDRYCLIRPYNKNYQGQETPGGKTLKARYYDLKPDFQFTRGYRWGLAKLRSRLNILLGIVSQAWQIARVVRREQCQAIIVCTGDILNPPAAFIASRLTGTVFLVYMLDWYSRQWPDPWEHRLTASIERWMMKSVAGIIAPNEFLRDDLEKEYGIRSTVIHNSCDLEPYFPVEPVSRPTSGTGDKQIVYAGAFYEFQLDAFQNLIMAFRQLNRPDIKLHLYIRRHPYELDADGTNPAIVFHGRLPNEAIPPILKAADILFLPLGFRTPYPQLVRTSAPGKTGELLASGRPILVNAPKDSFISWYFRRYDCGLVVDNDNPQELAAAIDSLLSDAELRTRLGTNAVNRAKADFDVSVAQAAFAQLLN